MSKNGKLEKGDPRPGLEHVPPGWILSPEVERFLGHKHGNQKRLFEALTKCGVHSIAIGSPGKAVLGWAWNQTEVLEREQQVRETLNGGGGSTVVRTIDVRVPPELTDRIRRLESAVRNLTAWASKHEGWHRDALGEPGQAGPDENLQLSLDIGDGEDGGDRPADRLGGSFGEAPGASKEGV